MYKVTNRQNLVGIFFTDGYFWHVQRRFSLRYLRDYGFGRRSDTLEAVIESEIKEMIDMRINGNKFPAEKVTAFKKGLLDELIDINHVISKLCKAYKTRLNKNVDTDVNTSWLFRFEVGLITMTYLNITSKLITLIFRVIRPYLKASITLKRVAQFGYKPRNLT